MKDKKQYLTVDGAQFNLKSIRDTKITEAKFKKLYENSKVDVDAVWKEIEKEL